MCTLLSYVEIEKKIEECHLMKKQAIAFFPIGCTEQHGPFLPIQTDTIISENVARSLSDDLGEDYWGYVFPSICYTPTKSNIHYAGTVSVDEELLRQYVKQICVNILKSEFDAIVLLSGHGPVDASLNEISFNLIHEQYEDKKSVIKPVFVLSLYDCRLILEDKLGQKSGQHADWRELLFLFYILGDNYFKKKMINDLNEFQQNNLFSIKESPVFGVPVELRSVQGVMGDPTPISKEDWNVLAKIAWDETIKHLCNFLKTKLNHF